MRLLVAFLFMLLIPIAYAEPHTFTVSLTGDQQDIVSIQGIPDKTFSEIVTQNYTSAPYLFGISNRNGNGLVFGEGILQQTKLEKFATTYKMSLQMDATHSKSYLVFTRGEGNRLRSIAESITQNRLLADQTLFGDVQTKIPTVFVGVKENSRIDIMNNASYSPGSYDIIVRNIDSTQSTEKIEIVRK